MTHRLARILFSIFLVAVLSVQLPESAYAGVSVVDRDLVSKRRVGRAAYDYTYTLSLEVNGPALDDVRVLVWCDNPGTTITDNEVVFGSVLGNSTTTSSGAEGTFTLRQNRRIPFDESCLNYSIRFVTLLKISGIATDKPLKKAKVTVTNSEPVIDDSGRPVVDNSGRPVVDNITTTTTTDDEGNYTVEVEANSQDGYVSLTAEGDPASDQSDATLTSDVGTVGSLHDVGTEGSIVVGSGEVGALNVTHITTAQDELVRRLNGGVPPTNDAELAALQAQVDGAELLILATAIKTIIDNPDIMLPPGIDNTLDWIQQDPTIVDQQVEQLQTDNPAEFEQALQETAEELQLGYTPDEVVGLLYALQPTEAPFRLGAFEFNFEDNGTGSVVTGAGDSPITWSINPAGEIAVVLTDPPVFEYDGFVDPPGAVIRVLQTTESLRIVRLADNQTTDQVFILEIIRRTFPDDPLPDEIFETTPDPDRVYIATGPDGFVPVEPSDIAGSQIAAYYYHTDNNAAGLIGSVLGADFLFFEADGSGTTQRRGFGFNWSVDAQGAVVVTYTNGESNRYLLFDESDIGRAIVIGTLTSGESITAASWIIDFDGTEFTRDQLENRRYRTLRAVLEPGGLRDYVFLPDGTGCFVRPIFARRFIWDVLPENYMDSFGLRDNGDPRDHKSWQAIRVVPGTAGDRYWVIDNFEAGSSFGQFTDPRETPGRIDVYEFIEDVSGQFDPCGLGSANSLTTLFGSDNGGVGNLFDVTTLNGAVEVSGLDVNVSLPVGTDFEVTVFTTPDTYMNGVSPSAGCTIFCVDVSQWTQVATGTGTAAGTDQPSFVGLPPFVLDGGTSTGFWVTLTRDGSIVDEFRYTTASGFVDNADIRIDIGAGVTAPSATTGLESVFPDRAWNGTVYYNTR